MKVYNQGGDQYECCEEIFLHTATRTSLVTWVFCRTEQKLNLNDAVTTQVVPDIGMDFGNKPTEFKDYISSSFSHTV